MRKITWDDRLRYRLDNLMSRGTPALIGMLAVLSVLLIGLTALFIWVTESSPESSSFPQLLWASLMRAMDAGTVAGDTGDYLFLGAMFGVTLGGIFILSMLIGILTTGFQERIEALRKGRSLVIEKEHTVILGWSDTVFTMVSELVTAAKNQAQSCIVILGDKDKVEMENELRERLGSSGKTRIVCRQGNPTDLNDLEIVNLQTAASIILNGNSDTTVIKMMLAITRHPARRKEPYNVVAVIRNPRNMEIAAQVGGDEVKLILADQLIARLTAQTCRQPGLSLVYSDLLDFAGDELYFGAPGLLAGKSFGDALLAFDSSAIIGLRRADGKVQLNLAPDTIVQPGDRVIAISADDDTVLADAPSTPSVQEHLIVSEKEQRSPTAEHTLILGWNHRLLEIVKELDSYVAPGSHLMVAAEYPDGQQELQQLFDPANGLRQRFDYVQMDNTDRAALEKLCETLPDHAILLSPLGYETQEADARTLITLLHLRDIAEKRGAGFSIVSEMLDLRNRDLAEVAKVNDFIVSDKLVSLMVTQVAENAELLTVFDELFGTEGCELYIRPVEGYVRTEEALNFYTLVAAANRKGELAVGYKLAKEAHDATKNYGIYLNPIKSRPISLQPGDGLIVLADD